jgi:hypothetical protein
MTKPLQFLPGLITLLVLALVLHAADPTQDRARAAFERGNALLRDAQQACAQHEPDLLRQAAGHYRDCLANPLTSPNARVLTSAARHNLELTKLLLTQAGPAEPARREEAKKERAPAPAKENGIRKDPSGNPLPATDRTDAARTPGETNAREDVTARPEAPRNEAGWNQPPQRQADAPKLPAPQEPDNQCPT